VQLRDEEKCLHKRIAVLLVKVFVEVESEKFVKRMDSVFGLILNEINYEKYTKVIKFLIGLLRIKWTGIARHCMNQ